MDGTLEGVGKMLSARCSLQFAGDFTLSPPFLFAKKTDLEISHSIKMRLRANS